MSTVSANHLKAMGYRQLGSEPRWAKPVGYSLFVFDLVKQEWSCLFRAYNNGDPLVWDSEPYTLNRFTYEDREETTVYEKPEEWLARIEAWQSAIARGKEEPWPFLDLHEMELT